MAARAAAVGYERDDADGHRTFSYHPPPQRTYASGEALEDEPGYYETSAGRPRAQWRPPLLQLEQESIADALLLERVSLTSIAGPAIANAPDAFDLFLNHAHLDMDVRTALRRVMELTTVLLARALQRHDDTGDDDDEGDVACLRAQARTLFTLASGRASAATSQRAFWSRVAAVGGQTLVRELAEDESAELYARAAEVSRSRAALDQAGHAFRGRGYNKPHQKARQGDRRPAQPNHRSRSPRGQSPRGRPGGTAAAAARRAAGGAGAP